MDYTVAIDPGNVHTAMVVLKPDGNIWHFHYDLNEIIRLKLGHYASGLSNESQLVIEMIASYGMPVGQSVFDTCVWIGQFIRTWNEGHEIECSAPRLIVRNAVKNHICHSSRATDANIRQALIDRFGGKEKALGTKKQPGPMFRMNNDCRAALALAITAFETTDKDYIFSKADEESEVPVVETSLPQDDEPTLTLTLPNQDKEPTHDLSDNLFE